MPRALSLALSVAVVIALPATSSCHRGSAGPAAVETPPFEVVAIWPVAHRTLDLPVWVLFSEPVDPQSLTADTVRIEAVDGPGVGAQVRGAFAIRSLGDGTFANSIAEFTPALPTGDGPLLAGLSPDTRYAVTVPAGGVRSRDGRAVTNAASFTFRTVAGSTVGELFGGGPAGGPQVVAVAAAPLDAEQRLRLGRFAEGPVTVRVHFDQALEATSANVPQQTNAAARGAVWLEYDDPEYGPSRWIDCAVAIERNAYDGATVALWPRGVLPSAATLRVVVRRDLRDLVGERDPAPQTDRVVATWRTEAALDAQRDAAHLDLTAGGALDPTAAFTEPSAIGDGDGLHAGDSFLVDEEGALPGDWQPVATNTVLDTDSDTLLYTNGGHRSVHGGVFRVRNLHVPPGFVVAGRGSQPLVFVVDGDARIDGLLTVRGGDAQPNPPVLYRGPGDIAAPRGPHGPWGLAGQGTCGGQGGGNSSLARDLGVTGLPEDGRGSHGAGGRRGAVACSGCSTGSGGGGGTFTTAGDPGYPWPSLPGSGFAQRLGVGGSGCAGASGAASRSLPGGAAGLLPFVDQSAGNDFHGLGYEPRRGLRVSGELPALRGGAGGGAGGDRAANACTVQYGAFVHGGSGGGGGGVVVLRVRGRIEIGASGRISADGGHGIGGDQMQMSTTGGGGGGGSGGSVVLMAGERIVLHTHGETFANRDYDFAISADGGICSSFAIDAPSIRAKYPANGEPTRSGAEHDARPQGGFGGLGLIQLMVPVGTTNDDDTNTVLDDHIDIVQNGVPLRATAKIRYLAWRGLADENGAFVDDFGNPTGFAYGEGDLRPSPVLLPVPFGPQSRARTTWLPLGAVARRALAAPDGAPRGVLTGPDFVGGPDFLTTATDSDGWLRFAERGRTLEPGGARMLAQPAVVSSIVVETTEAGAVYVGRLAAPALAGERDRFVGMLAELQNAVGEPLLRLRVRSHDADTLRLMAAAPLPFGIAALQIVDWPIDGDLPSLVYTGADGRPVPRVNLRLGYAFHRAPERALASGDDPDRYPTAVGTFLRRLDDPAVRDALRAFGATSVQWDLVVDRRYRRTPADQPPPVDAAAELSLRHLWLPFRF